MPPRSRSGSKVFVVGFNKTGTSSVRHALASMGFRIGDQPKAEGLLEDWAVRDFREIVQHCRTADAFQDVPFSLDYTYQILDHSFPRSRFILTVRNDSQEWYESLTRFHAKVLRTDGIPTAEDLKRCVYRDRGWLWRFHQYVFGAQEDTVYDRDLYVAVYERHNAMVREYFRARHRDLLVLNVAGGESMQSLSQFLGVEAGARVMPHLNRSDSLR